MQHDAQLDYYGKRLATCSSDKTIRIFNVVKGEAQGEPVILKGYVEAATHAIHNVRVPCPPCRDPQLSWRERGRSRSWNARSDGCRHTAPVWQLAWAHPSFGSILASCSYDGRVFIWKEVGAGGGKGSGGELQDGWERIKEHTLHTASGQSSATCNSLALLFTDVWALTVNSVAWAPYDLGPILACASSDGKISVLSFQSTLLAQD